MNTTVSWLEPFMETFGAYDRRKKTLDETMLYPYINAVISLSKSLSELLSIIQFQTVASAADPFSIALTQWVVFHILPHKKELKYLPMIYPIATIEQCFRPNFLKYIKGFKVLIVQGVITPERLLETLNLIRNVRIEGGEVVGLATVYNQTHLSRKYFDNIDIFTLL